MERIAIAHTETWLRKKCYSPNFKMETQPRALIASTLISTLNPRGSSCSSKASISAVQPEDLATRHHWCFSTKSHHLNIPPFSCLAHVSVDDRKRTPRIHQHHNSLPAHVHIYGAQRRNHILPGGGDETDIVNSPPGLTLVLIPEQFHNNWPGSPYQKHVRFSWWCLTVVFRSLASSEVMSQHLCNVQDARRSCLARSVRPATKAHINLSLVLIYCRWNWVSVVMPGKKKTNIDTIQGVKVVPQIVYMLWWVGGKGRI